MVKPRILILIMGCTVEEVAFVVSFRMSGSSGFDLMHSSLLARYPSLMPRQSGMAARRPIFLALFPRPATVPNNQPLPLSRKIKETGINAALLMTPNCVRCCTHLLRTCARAGRVNDLHTMLSRKELRACVISPGIKPRLPPVSSSIITVHFVCRRRNTAQ